MAFQPTLPSPADWFRDPVGSFQLMWQAFNYDLDRWNAQGAEIPALYSRIDGYNAAIQKFPAASSRAALIAALQKLKSQLDALVARRNDLGGKVNSALVQIRAEANRIMAAVPTAHFGQPIIVLPLVIAVVGIAIYEMGQWATAHEAVKLQDQSLGNQILQYAKAQGLTPAQIGAMSGDLSKLPAVKPPAGGDPFGEILGALPWILGIGAAIYFAPVVMGALKARPRGRAA